MTDIHIVAHMSSAARNGLTVIAPIADPGVQITGNYVTPPAAADTIKAVTTLSAAIANNAESYLQNTADPTLYRYYAGTDQTTIHHNGVVRMNKITRNTDGTLAQILAYENNANNAEYEAVLYWLAPAGSAHPTTKMPKLPSNARVVTATGAITAVAGAWTTGALALNSFNPIPGQKYAVYGMGMMSATGYAFRFAPASGMTPSALYPGTLASDTKGLLEVWYREDGAPWFIWDGINFPNIQLLCSAGDTAEYVQLVIGEV